VSVILRGSSPSVHTAGILLLSRARSFGLPFSVTVVGDPSDITPVSGPAVVHSNVLASCGIGRELGQGALVVVPGPADQALMVCLGAEGTGGWFGLDTSGRGTHAATQAFVRLARDKRPRARDAGRLLSRALHSLGVPPEPAVLDMAFLAPVPPLTRVALALRTGQAMTGERGLPLMRALAHGQPHSAPFDADIGGEAVLELWREGQLEALLGRFPVRLRYQVEHWLEDLAELAVQDGGRDLDLVAHLAELISHLAVLPPASMLPPPDAASDAVAVGVTRALGATRGEHDVSKALAEVYRFLGGQYIEASPYAIQLPDEEAPAHRLGRWRWFLGHVTHAAQHAEELWRRVIDLDS